MHRDFFISSFLIADIAIEGGIWLTAAMIDATDANSPLVLSSARAAEAFARSDAIRELATLSEENRHRMFIAGFRRIKPHPGQLGTIFEKMLEKDSTVVDEVFRIQWLKRCDVLTPNGHQAEACPRAARRSVD
ncbi:hypothetical protein IVA80_29160 [Bradyrhizobium sp. 139]|uniref:hypothetical protein n=1 Tax=Bradyrhizobium sp. 139 TaxID=2782616 RepID=UPI001FFACC33|nr:hypothetical protein [Bradyrhizobium sp. 139]MCK1744780.1 hypothetical protein [Bradyrhizobium sp. 139]